MYLRLTEGFNCLVGGGAGEFLELKVTILLEKPSFLKNIIAW